MASEEKKQVLSGAFWKFSERITAQVVSLLVSIILARLLAPSEYGIIALVNVFVAIANVFVNSGFGLALIQKKNADSIDFSSVFYFSLFFTIVIYVILFFLAIPISNFYNMPQLKSVLRVLSISIPIMGFNSIQQAYVSRNMDFRKFFYATIIGTIISAVVGIILAYLKFGVWALVAQSLTNNIIDTIILQITIKWKITLEFSFDRLKRLFNYGSKLLVQALVLQFYASLRNLLIGKLYTPADLSFYTKGNTFPDLICSNIDTSINTVLFPAMSKSQDSIEKVKRIARKTTSISSYVMSPILVGLIVVSYRFVSILLTDKWLPCVPYLIIESIILLFRAPQTAMLQGIKSVGRSGAVLKVDFPIRVFALIVLLISIRFGVLCLALSEILVTIFGTMLFSYMANKILRYSFFEMLADFMKNVMLSCVMGGIVFLIGFVLPFHRFIILIIQIMLGILIYILLSIVIKSEDYKEIKVLIYDMLMPKVSRLISHE